MPHGLPELAAYGILIAFSSFVVVHWIRRSFRPLEITEPGTVITLDDVNFFDRFQRLYHWATSIAFVGTLVTGLALYDPTTFEPAIVALGIPFHGYFPDWVLVHTVFASALGVLLVSHIAWDLVRLRTIRKILPSRRDVRDASTRIRNFFGLSNEYPRMGKYDFFMQSFHIYLAVAFLVLALTGAYQYFFAPWWLYPWNLHEQIEPLWRPTALHDAFGFLVVAVVVGHTYFALLNVNRPLLRAMISGKLKRDEVGRRYRVHPKDGGAEI